MTTTALVQVTQTELLADHIGFWRRVELECRQAGGRCAGATGTAPIDVAETFAFPDHASAQRFADQVRDWGRLVALVEGP